MLELRRRYKPEVAAFSDYIGRDLVKLWGYDRSEELDGRRGGSAASGRTAAAGGRRHLRAGAVRDARPRAAPGGRAGAGGDLLRAATGSSGPTRRERRAGRGTRLGRGAAGREIEGARRGASCTTRASRPPTAACPLLEPPLARALRRAGLPVVAIMHELVFPFGRDGARGLLWAAHAPRGAGRDRCARASGLLVTTEERGEWLAEQALAAAAAGRVRAGLLEPARAVRLAAPTGRAAGPRRVRLLLRRLRRGGAGRAAAAGGQGRSPAAAADRLPRAGLARRPRMGRTRRRARRRAVLHRRDGAPAALGRRSRASDLLLFADPPGPTSRKGTLAGSLASGAPLIALDGPATWPELAAGGRGADRAARRPPPWRTRSQSLARRSGGARRARCARARVRRRRDGRGDAPPRPCAGCWTGSAASRTARRAFACPGARSASARGHLRRR